MQNVNGKTIYSNIEEIVEPKHTVLVVWDVQNMLVNSIFNREEFIANLTMLIDSARKSGIPIFYTAIQFLPPRFQSQAWLYAMNKRFSNQQRQQKPPTRGDLELTIHPRDEEIVINKHTASVFIGTHFEQMIRNATIETIVFTGISTEFGIESSARDAFNRGFYSVIVSDAVSSMDKEAHERSLDNMRKLVSAIVTSRDISRIWANVPT
jgi:nicotinamidase-related amidase